ncbi:MAG: flavodoxin family protein [Ruminiclostridium sp.]
MKAIVVYFSLEGHSKYTADKIAESLGADTLILEPVKDYPKGNVSKFFWGGKSVVFGEKPKLAAYDFSAINYDVIIIGTPVWAGSFTPPIKTFIRDNDLSNKKIALFACHSGGGAEKCFNKLKQELADSNVVATLELINPGNNQKDDYAQKIEEFCHNISSLY